MPKLETILSAAVNSMIRGHHEPHCFSAHVIGKGYVNDGTDPSSREDYLRQLERTAKQEIENIGFAPGYAEPGYSDPESGVLFANWNCLPKGLDDILERAGYAIEWSDEWSTCEDCGKAVRTSPDSYGYTPHYREDLIESGTFVCLDCCPVEDEDITVSARQYAVAPSVKDDEYIPADYVDLCREWHSGQSCMLYAVASTGFLGKGNHRPWNGETSDYATDEEWQAILWRDLSSDVAHAARMAEKSEHVDATYLRSFESYCDAKLERMGQNV